MRDKVVIVTGGSKGLGKYMAKDFVENGAKVVITGRNEDSLTAAKKEIAHENGEIDTIQMDVSDVSAVKKTVNTVIEKWGRIDVLVNNAAVRKETGIEEIDEEEWNNIVSINLGGTFFFSQAVIEQMKSQKWGRIINVSSYGGQAGPLTSGAHYCASKAGQFALTKTFARYLADSGITVNTVSPAAIESPEMEKMDSGKLKVMKRSIPVQRFGKSEEVAKMVSYLASDSTGYITGATFDINGGLLMR
ncbi:3-oxoacyl-[acyl-carrier protein] reductase [Virgibacillus halotolerans]|uniref:SDR family NAD(P)-dependent oxidoreductase n=1 Tax=Virgibacillus halotolerans TaxID=1071053 RepID=UPI001960BC05|nr:SDR family NAD(P)-dependent oxidoreductase [Virgibacillus halotolerans]MBM7599224.1 3-oxoacyl-[acyl-carrier protein] reductase [Virgibacillus halotolerans]